MISTSDIVCQYVSSTAGFWKWRTRDNNNEESNSTYACSSDRDADGVGRCRTKLCAGGLAGYSSSGEWQIRSRLGTRRLGKLRRRSRNRTHGRRRPRNGPARLYRSEIRRLPDSSRVSKREAAIELRRLPSHRRRDP